MDIRQLQYLVALAREKHFTRAAAACNVTQPTLSGRIRQLELELSVPIVERGQRYQGLTQEGERILKWAQLILNNWSSMHQELAHLATSDFGLIGRIALGAIPSALSMLPRLTREVRKLHPRIDFSILSLSSEEILRGLDDYSLDVGISYLDNEPINGLLSQPLYVERYCLFVPMGHPLESRTTLTWQEAAELPLGLPTPNMQNRRIIDKAFKIAGVRPIPALESNSIINLYSSVQLMGVACIMPRDTISLLGTDSELRAVPLVEPELSHSVGLLTAERDPVAPLVRAFRVAASEFCVNALA